MAQLGLRKWGSQLTTIDKEKHRRELLRKEKLTSLLNQKIHRAFGLSAAHPTIEDEIEYFVSNNQGDFSELKLKKLQNEIATKLAPEGIVLKRKRTTRASMVAANAGLGIAGINNTIEAAPRQGLSRASVGTMSVKSIAGSRGKAQSIRGSQMSQRSTSHRSLAESDQWREIENFNTLLHLEEQNQEIIREKTQQRLIKDELDKQIREKKEKVRQERETEKMYEDMQRRLMQDAERKEKLKVENMRSKIQRDKEGRDRQIIMEQVMRKGEIEREKAQETIMINKLKKEMELEKLAVKEQKKTWKTQLESMKAENNNNQYLLKVAKDREREEDEKIQRELMKSLEAQQNKEANNAKQRDDRQTYFVNKMATDVLSKVEERNKREEDIIQKYTEERMMKEKLEEERRLRKSRLEQSDMKAYLTRQVKDKKNKDGIDKEVIEEQAKLWAQDRAKFNQEEKKYNAKMKNLSNQNADLLQKQMDESRARGKGMDAMEYEINRTYLKNIRSKKADILNEGV
jgi:hypothetical protein